MVDIVYMNRPRVANVNKETAELAEDVFESIHTVMHLLRSEQYRVVRLGRYDLTHMEGKILGFFIRHPGGTLRELVAHLRQDKGQLARLIRSLRIRNCLKRRPTPGTAGVSHSIQLARAAASIKFSSNKSESFQRSRSRA